jgi:hypothetical protein
MCGNNEYQYQQKNLNINTCIFNTTHGAGSNQQGDNHIYVFYYRRGVGIKTAETCSHPQTQMPTRIMVMGTVARHNKLTGCLCHGPKRDHRIP